MRTRVFLSIGVTFLSAMFFAASAKAQTAAPAADASKAPATAKAIFYFDQPAPVPDCLEQSAVQIDGVTVHQIGQFHVWETDVAPGTHVFTDDSHKDKGLTATVAPGQSYYFSLRVYRGGFMPSCKNFYAKFFKADQREITKANDLLGKPIADESFVVPAPAAPAATAAPVPVDTNVKLSVDSVPGAADIEIDGNFMGNTPSAIELSPGNHTVIVSKSGYKPWQRTIKLVPGDIKLSAELEAIVAPAPVPVAAPAPAAAPAPEAAPVPAVAPAPAAAPAPPAAAAGAPKQ
jgi:hypothetical protein